MAQELGDTTGKEAGVIGHIRYHANEKLFIKLRSSRFWTLGVVFPVSKCNPIRYLSVDSGEC